MIATNSRPRAEVVVGDVAELMGDDRPQDRTVGSVDEVVVEDDPPARADPVDVGVDAGAAPGGVDVVDVADLDPGRGRRARARRVAQRPGGKLLEVVEDRRQDDRREPGADDGVGDDDPRPGHPPEARQATLESDQDHPAGRREQRRRSPPRAPGRRATRRGPGSRGRRRPPARARSGRSATRAPRAAARCRPRPPRLRGRAAGRAGRGAVAAAAGDRGRAPPERSARRRTRSGRGCAARSGSRPRRRSWRGRSTATDRRGPDSGRCRPATGAGRRSRPRRRPRAPIATIVTAVTAEADLPPEGPRRGIRTYDSRARARRRRVASPPRPPLMQVAVFSDIHANLPAFEAILRDSDEVGVAERWCLGDVIGYGADPDLCVELARERCEVCLVGNHDLAVLGELDTSTFSSAAAAAVEWTTEHTSKPNLDFLAGLAPSDISHEAALYHASPRDPVWEYVLWPEQAADCLAAQDKRVSFVGHSHVALFFSATGGTGRRRQRGPRLAGRCRHPPRDRRGAMADQPRQRRPAPRRRPAGGVARARHRELGGHLPPGRLRHRAGGTVDRGRRAPGTPRTQAFPRAMRPQLHSPPMSSAGRLIASCLVVLAAGLVALGCGSGSDGTSADIDPQIGSDLTGQLDKIAAFFGRRELRPRQQGRRDAPHGDRRPLRRDRRAVHSRRSGARRQPRAADRRRVPAGRQADELDDRARPRRSRRAPTPTPPRPRPRRPPRPTPRRARRPPRRAPAPPRPRRRDRPATRTTRTATGPAAA